MLSVEKLTSKKSLGLIALLVAIAILNLLSFNSWVGALGGWVTGAATLLFWHQTRFWRGFIPLFLVSWISIAIAWAGATPVFGVAHYIFMGMNTLIAFIPFILDRWLTPRTANVNGRPFLSTLIFPSALVAVEYLGVFGSPLGTFGAAGYSQIALPWLIQLVSLTGLLGIAFVTGWFASTVVWVWEQRQNRFRVHRGLAVYGVFLLLVVAFGTVRLLVNRAETRAEGVNIAAFTAATWKAEELFPKLESDLPGFRSETQAAHVAYLTQTADAADAGAQLVVWPEGALLGTNDDVQAAVEQTRFLAREKGIYIGAPTFEFYPGSDRPAENRLLVIDPQGEIVINHIKYGGNFMEGTLAGDQTLQVVDTPFGTLSGVICWDADFPAVIRQAGQADVDILLVPSRDWAEITPLHGEMATFRAIENGLTVVRQADQGLSLIVDPFGRRLTAADHFAPGGQTMTAAVPIRSTATVYTWAGEWLGILSVAGTVVLTGWALVRRRQIRTAADRAPQPAVLTR